ncbi:efflux RND transporter periplasmic adaptor subunit [Amycolatopsis taiwanensis]|uniref:efflux RND transporter periplasmic adaptor subunit n=1 Tax=Amycolatopsis taiwanensis TaxID=342230 RepID=UPI000481D725|nr:HlyD family efflux transporter periplasmic adaptor subunit [Amycolatopsis taiwanensis]
MGRRLRRILLIVALVVVAGGGVTVWAASGSPVGGYRTATAAGAEVTATLDTTGTIQPVSQATVAFPISGQVSSVGVQQGQQVTAGQALAQLDTTSLATQLATAQSTLAGAQARLAGDQSGQVSAASGAAGHATPAAYVTTAAPAPDLKSLQDAVISAQSKLDQDLQKASALLKTEEDACQQVIAPPSGDSAKSTTVPSQDQVDACTKAIQDAQNAQSATADDGKRLFNAENALSDALSKALAAAEPGTTPRPSQTPAPGKGSTSKGGVPKSPSGGSSSAPRGQPASAEQLAADQAAIDAANAQVAVARQNLAAATLVSPIDGTVAQIGFTVGQQSGEGHIVVNGPGANQVTTAVSDTQAGQIKPGQQAIVTPDGSGTPITGQVTSIGLLSSTTSSGSPSYPVTISLPSSAQQLFPGATASVSIITSTANAAVTVPTSALHLEGANASVTVLVNGQPETRRITVGVIGPSVTEVQSGLVAGEQVVLADLSQPLPSSNPNGNRGAFGGGGGSRGVNGGGGGARPGGGG